MGHISSQSLTLTNEGTTTVYFEWKKEKPNIPFTFESEDYADYFHIHNVPIELQGKRSDKTR